MAFHPFRRRRPYDREFGSDDQTPAVLSATGVALAEEAEAFLAGRLADRFADTGRGVPAWALLNRLAHGSIDELTALLVAAQGGWRAHPSALVWTAAERRLALRLLSTSGTPGELRSLQSAVLIPVEFELTKRPTALSPEDVIAAVTQALDEHILDR
jgi:hypothetical protein